jgi:hypothetical protein
MAKSDVMVLNNYNGGTLERRTRFNKAGVGKDRYTVTIKSEPLLIQTDPKALGAGPAVAIAEHLKQAIAGITETVSPATMKARLSAQKAVMNGETWATRRYGGGKMGTRAPARSDRLFNDSGRFIESIAARPNRDGYTINIAGNRLDPSTLNGGEAALVAMMDRLREHVPEWGDASKLMDVLSVRRAIKDGLKEMTRKTNERTLDMAIGLMDRAFSGALRILKAG